MGLPALEKYAYNQLVFNNMTEWFGLSRLWLIVLTLPFRHLRVSVCLFYARNGRRNMRLFIVGPLIICILGTI